MKFFTALPNVTQYPPVAHSWYRTLTPADMRRIVRTIDSLNFDVINVPDHIVTPGSHLEAMGSHWLHGPTCMGFAAGASEKLRIMSSVIVVPYHNVIELAKMLATMDYISGGRIDFAIGVGHSPHEFEALGVPFEDRGRRTDEYIAAMKVLWTEAKPEFKGEFVNFHDIYFDPKPVQKPHIPILVGGNKKVSLRRAAKYGDGWYPWLIGSKELPACLDYLRSQPEFDANKPFNVVLPVSHVQVKEEDHRPVGGGPDGRPKPMGFQQIIDEIGKLKEFGVTTTSIPVPKTASVQEYLDYLQKASEEIIPKFRKV